MEEKGRTMVRAVSRLAILAVLFAGASAHAADYKTTCSRGSDARVIEVITPGEVGQSCDVRYSRGEGNVSVPYHADNADSFCNEKARSLAQRLSSAGFTCAAAPPALRAEAQPEGDADESDYVVEARRIAPAEEQPVETADASGVGAGVTEPRPVVLQPAPAQVASVEESEGALEDEMNKILTQPSVDASSGEPMQLASQASETPRVGPQPSAVGRLTGADPQEPRPAAPVTQAAAIIPVPEETAASEPAPAPAQAAQTPPTDEKKPGAPRTPADIIRATLHAQAAAWNEGDLDGFMAGYWKSEDLKFISGVEITRGWSTTLKRYRDRYAGAQGGLGQLTFDRLEPKLVTDDVAVVTGRFNLAQRDGNTSSGLFTLVMRRDNGAWRIVHDHSSLDAPAAQ
jgi:beta-aspartyl-peptidase (threonine type)